MRQLGAAVQTLVPADDSRGVLSARRRDVEDALPTREAERVVEQCIVRVAAHPEDLRLGHNPEYCRALVRRSSPCPRRVTSTTSTSRPTADGRCWAGRG